MIIKHATIYPMDGPAIQSGFIQIEGKAIKAVGPMDACPQENETFDATGMTAMPGLIDAHCHIGMWEDGLGFEGDDGNEDTDPATPHLRAVDAINPLDRAFEEALDAGITTVVTGPGSANPISGQFCAMKTYGRRVDDMLVKAPLAIKFALGENPKTSYHAKSQSPVTRMGVAAIIREQLSKAQKYLKQQTDAQEDDELEEPEFDAKCEALLPLLKGEIQAHIHAHRADDIFTALRIAKEFGVEPVLIHATEGHLVAEELAREDVPVIAGPMLCARTKPELAKQTDKNPAILQNAGISVAISSDHPELPCSYLLLSAQLAAASGMERDIALRAITGAAAAICRIDDRVGTLSPGKDADIVLFDGDPLSLLAKPRAVFLEGKKVRG